jgi:hypothetical protein
MILSVSLGSGLACASIKRGWSRFDAENLDGCDCNPARIGVGRVQQMRCSRPVAEILQDRPGNELSC